MHLEPTGERMIEEFYQNSPENYLIYLFHMATYDFARSHVDGRCVLDYGCGSGYGTHHVAPSCKSIVGVDIAEEAIQYAQANYRDPNLSYRPIEPADKAPLPFESESFDTVLSFQVIEHIRDPRPYLAEIERVLKPGGIFICATPDRSTRLLPGQKPWNMWHVLEYDAAGLIGALAASFPNSKVLRMGGRAEVLNIEIRRARKAMWMTLPLTLPFTPERLRVQGLKLMKQLAGQGRRQRVTNTGQFGFDQSDIRISEDARPSVNLVAIGRKQ